MATIPNKTTTINAITSRLIRTLTCDVIPSPARAESEARTFVVAVDVDVM